MSIKLEHILSIGIPVSDKANIAMGIFIYQFINELKVKTVRTRLALTFKPFRIRQLVENNLRQDDTISNEDWMEGP